MFVELSREVPRWALPFQRPARWKAAWGGRGSGKSHEFAAMLIEEHVKNPDCRSVCIREIQKSLKYSVKSLLEAKIKELGVGHLFRVLDQEIRSRIGTGLIIFAGMQDHTAESIKSLEGFDIAWVEEAQSLSARSMKLLLPTIRKAGSQLWFTWNPDQPADPVDNLFRGEHGAPPDAIVVPCHYRDNPWLTDELLEQAERMLATDPDAYEHVWGGGYNTRSAAAVLAGKYVVEEFEVGDDWDGPYHGLDFGFAMDPTAAVRLWIHERRLYLEREAVKVGLELDDTAAYVVEKIPNAHLYVIRADNARPESISHLKRHGLPRIEPCEKWAGSVEDGIAHLRSYEKIVIHPQCTTAREEARLYSYKIDKRTGDILPDIVDKHNHVWDGVRYALGPMIQRRGPNFLLVA